ncbi:MAG TPA: GNAT family N-acetyltransferase [Frankiaceae bacterium]|jgi:ribosomal protein S18 acetylase RimI-like enzyme|nr:GNAT family N-acetyltransferase [Frankiaceae bacterium]
MTDAYAIAGALWRERGPYVDQHVGDLAWGAPSGTVTMVGDDSYVFAEGLAWQTGGPAHDAIADLALEAGASVAALDAETEKTDALRRRGFVADESRWHWHLHRTLDDLPPVTVPPSDYDLDERVALHRAAWEPSRFTRERYDVVRATPPYRPELDVMVRTPEGEPAAYLIAWYDAVSRSGELEPVGTAPAHRRKGYGAAACVAALHRLRDAGATQAVVYAVSDPANQGARLLYESVGFRVIDRHVEWRPPIRQNAAQGGNT